jgi:hypothetical protein
MSAGRKREPSRGRFFMSSIRLDLGVALFT